MRTASPLRSALLAAVMTWAAAPVAAQQAGPEESGAVSPPPAGFFTEPRPLARLMAFGDRRVAAAGTGAHDGFFVDFSNMITGSGWISAGPGVRKHIFSGRAVVTTSAALSWRLYRMAQARIEVPDLAHGHASAGVQANYRDNLQVNFFGVGNDSSVADRTGFRLKTGDVSAYGLWHADRLTATARAGWLGYVDVSRMSGWGIDYPDTQVLFSDATAPGLASQPSFVHADASLALDLRDDVADPSRGGVYRASAARYVDRASGRYTFDLYELDAAQYVTIAQDRVVLGGHAWAALTATGAGEEVPFYLMPNLGGKNTLRGLDDFRFYDRNMETFSLESRVRLYAHLDGAVFVDTGKVAPRPGALGLTDMHTTVGVGIRVRSRNVTFARLDIARGSEGWHFLFIAREPFKRKTFTSQSTSVAPFVP